MLKGLIELAHAAQTAPLPSCSCAKGLAVGVECLASALARSGGEGGSGGATVADRAAQARIPSTSGPAGPTREEELSLAAYHSVEPSEAMPAHDAHALRMVLLRNRSSEES